MNDILEIMKDRWDGWELAEMLALSVEDVYYAFEDRFDEDTLADIKELLNIEDDNDNDE